MIEVQKVAGRGLRVNLKTCSKLRFGLIAGDDYLQRPNMLRVRGLLPDFLPDIALEEDSGNPMVLFQFIRKKDQASRSYSIQRRPIPAPQLDKFAEAMKGFIDAGNQTDTADIRKRQIIERFRLPDPKKDPEMYRTYGAPWDRRLLVLWGVEGQPASSLAPVEAIAILRDEFCKPLWQVWLERLGWLSVPCLILLLVAYLLIPTWPTHLPGNDNFDAPNSEAQ